MTSNKEIKISIGGDLMCSRYMLSTLKKGYSFANYVGAIKPLFCNSDYVIANLETPIGADRREKENVVSFNTPVKFLVALKDVGFNFFSTANNHCLDCGIDGINATIDNLDKFGFVHDGTFRTKEESEQIPIVDVCGMKLSVLSFTFGTNSQINGVMLPSDEQWRVSLLKRQPKRRVFPIEDKIDCDGNFHTYIADEVSPAAIGNPVNEAYLKSALDKVRKAKDLADFVIVMPHVGGQYNPGPATYAKYIVSRFKLSGADMVIAGHPHVVQRCEKWMKGDAVFATYSLGNLCSTPGKGFFVRNVQSEYGIVLHAYIDTLTKKLSRITFDVVKNVVGEDGCAHSFPVVDIFEQEKNAAARDRLQMEVEAIVNRFRGTCDDVEVRREYELSKSEFGVR